MASDRKLIVVIAAALVATIVACAGSIVKTEPDRALSPDEIKAALRSDDFRQKNKARDQLGKLAEPDRIALLTELTRDEDPATRTLAISELAKIDKPEARAPIERVAAEDKDEDVRDVAKALLGIEEETAATGDGGPPPTPETPPPPAAETPAAATP